MENHRSEEEILTVKGLSVSFTQYDRGFGREGDPGGHRPGSEDPERGDRGRGGRQRIRKEPAGPCGHGDPSI